MIESSIFTIRGHPNNFDLPFCMIANERAYEETSKFKILAFSERPLQ